MKLVSFWHDDGMIGDALKSTGKKSASRKEEWGALRRWPEIWQAGIHQFLSYSLGVIPDFFLEKNSAAHKDKFEGETEIAHKHKSSIELTWKLSKLLQLKLVFMVCPNQMQYRLTWK